jgi:choice-of-anchor A domain-containing protein
VIRVNGDFTLPSSGGQGTLIVMGNLTISGNNMWHGILLVGGQLTSNGNGTMMGATMSGLNTIFTPAQRDSAQALAAAGTTISTNPANATANGTKTYQYDSCEVSKAAGGLASYSVFPNAWMDNFVTY